MLVKINTPSTMDAEITNNKDTILTARPRRYSRSQRRVNMIPFSVEVDGQFLDQGYITVDLKTGKLTVEHRLNEIPLDTEEDEPNV